MKDKKRLGILAGMGPRSTAPFIAAVYDECRRQYGARCDEDFPEIVILSWPTPFFIDCPIDDRKMAEAIVAGLKELQKAKAAIIAMPCNSAHAYFDQVKRGLRAELLDMIGETVKAAGPGMGRATLLATPVTMASGLYQKKLMDAGIEYYFDGRWQDEANELILMIKDRNDAQAVEMKYARLEDEMARAGINAVILACTDLSVIRSDRRRIRVIDSGQALAAALIRRYRETGARRNGGRGTA